MRDSHTGHTAWTLSPYQPADGPFLERNTDATKTIAASAEIGTVTLNASAPLFEPGHVGALWWLQMPDLAAMSPWESDVTAPTVNSYCRYNGHYYKALTIGSSNKTGTVPPSHDEGAGYRGLCASLSRTPHARASDLESPSWRRCGRGAEGFRRFADEELFQPLHMDSMTLEFDAVPSDRLVMAGLGCTNHMHSGADIDVLRTAIAPLKTRSAGVPQTTQ